MRMGPTEATEHIRRIANDSDFDVLVTAHAKAKMNDRNLIMGDILHVLKNGFVFNEAEEAKQKGCFKYSMECTTPNSNGRKVRVIAIPSDDRPAAKIITIMWVDES